MTEIEPPSVGAFSVKEFCHEYKISKPFFYQLLRTGRAPATFKLGRRRLISKESAAAWRRALEQENA